MKILKYLAVVLLVLVGGWIVLCFFSPVSLNVERGISISTPAAVVFNEVECLDGWPAWSSWSKMDSTMVNTYSEIPCGTGAWNSWTGEKSGSGKQTVVDVEENTYIKMTLAFAQQPGEHISEWRFAENDSTTDVTWNFIGAETPFIVRPFNLLIKSILVKSYDSGLTSLKAVCESEPFAIRRIDLPAQRYLLVSAELKPDGIGQFYAENFGKIMMYLSKQDRKMEGSPTGLFYTWTDTLTQMAAAIPVAADVDGTEDISFQTIEAGPALSIDYYGDYGSNGAAHGAMDDYMSAHGLELDGAVREVYVTDPEAEPDTSKWLTRIICPVNP